MTEMGVNSKGDLSAVVLRTVAAPKQARSERSLQRILEAAEALIEEKGLAEASIPEIVQRASSSVGGFYARFRDKNELLRALEERFFRELAARVEALADMQRWSDAAVDEIVDACVAELVQISRQRRNLLQAFLHRAIHDSEVREEALRFQSEVTRRIRDLLLTRREQIGHPDPELAVGLGIQMAFGFMQQVVLAGGARIAERDLDDATLRRELARVFLSYVEIDGSGARSRS